MPIVTIPFDNDANYTKQYSGSYIEVKNSCAELKEANTDLIVHYKLDENPLSFVADGVIDSGSNESHPGTLYGSTATVGVETNAKYGTAYHLNIDYQNTNNYLNRIEIPTINYLPNGGQFSFSCWFWVTNDTGVNVIASQAGSATAGDRSWAVYRNGDAKTLVLLIEGGGTLYYPLNISWSNIYDWNHLAVNIDIVNGNYDMWINGTKYSVTGSTVGHSTTNPFTIGNHYNHLGDTTDRHFRGALDDFKIFKGLLTDTEVSTLYNATNPYVLTMPVAIGGFDAYIYNTNNANSYGTIAGLLSFNIITGTEHNGDFLFAIGINDGAGLGTRWNYWDGTSWVGYYGDPVNTKASTLIDIQNNIATLNTFDSAELYVATFLKTDGNTYPQIDEINIDIGVKTTSSYGNKIAVKLPLTSSYGIKAGVLWYSNITNYGNKLNVAPQPSLRYISSKFNVAPTEATRSIYSKFNVASTPELINYGSKYNLAMYDGSRSDGNKFLVNIGTSNAIGSKFNLIYNNETKDYGNKLTVSFLTGSDYGMRYTLPPQQVEVWDNRGMKAGVYTSHGKYEGKGMSFFLYSKSTISKGMKVTASKIAETVRGIKFNASGLTNIGIKFTIEKVWYYIDRLKTMVGDWTKI